MSYDGPKIVGANYYDVDLAVWALPVGAPIRQGRAWTVANSYTGGDMQPVPVSGGIMYTKFSYDENGNRVGQLWFTTRAGSAGRALTTTSAGCLQPSISPDGHTVAMVCTYQKQVSYLTIASWNGVSLGALNTVVSDQLVAQPIWAPDSDANPGRAAQRAASQPQSHGGPGGAGNQAHPDHREPGLRRYFSAGLVGVIQA
jgi:hypothetical protein